MYFKYYYARVGMYYFGACGLQGLGLEGIVVNLVYKVNKKQIMTVW